MSRRLDIKWTTISPNRCEGICELVITKNITELVSKKKFKVYIEKHSRGMYGIDGGTIPELSHEERERIHDVMSGYWNGVNNEENQYVWLKVGN